MRVTKCDRCGRVVMAYYSVTAVYNTNNLPCDVQAIVNVTCVPKQQYDLCSECMKHLKEVMTDEECPGV